MGRNEHTDSGIAAVPGLLLAGLGPGSAVVHLDSAVADQYFDAVEAIECDAGDDAGAPFEDSS